MKNDAGPIYIRDNTDFHQMQLEEERMEISRAHQARWKATHVKVALVGRPATEKRLEDLSEFETQDPLTAIVWRKREPKDPEE